MGKRKMKYTDCDTPTSVPSCFGVICRRQRTFFGFVKRTKMNVFIFGWGRSRRSIFDPWGQKYESPKQRRKNSPTPRSKVFGALPLFTKRGYKKNTRNQSYYAHFIHFSFDTAGAKEKFAKENAAKEFRPRARGREGLRPFTLPPFKKGGRKLLSFGRTFHKVFGSCLFLQKGATKKKSLPPKIQAAHW